MKSSKIGDMTDQLGESCVWSVKEDALWWIDIRGRTLRRHTPANGRTTSFAVPDVTGSIALHENGGIVLAMRTTLALFDPESGELVRLAAPDENCPNQRFNDGRCDRQGRFWVGTMDDVNRDAVASLYRLNSDRTLTTVFTSLTIPNALAWSPEGRTMYFSDTTSRTILAYDFDPVAGLPAQSRTFAAIDRPGTPDGSTVDEQGYVWNAEYDNWRVTRYAPDGRVDRRVDLPVQRPTCCAFGGPDLATLYVTTAAQNLTASAFEEQPLAGSLLALDVGVKGLPEPYYVEDWTGPTAAFALCERLAGKAFPDVASGLRCPFMPAAV